MTSRPAAEGRRLLPLAAACLLATLLLSPTVEASRGLPAAFAPALTSPSTANEVLSAELEDPPQRLRLFDDLRLPERPLELVEARKTASGVSTWNLGLNVRQTGGLSQNRSGLSFQGLWTDPVTGISYARNRWYDARTASWLSEDPMGAVDSPNLYAFVGWGPHMGRDPLGLAEVGYVQAEFGPGDVFSTQRVDSGIPAIDYTVGWAINEARNTCAFVCNLGSNFVWAASGTEEMVIDLAVEHTPLTYSDVLATEHYFIVSPRNATNASRALRTEAESMAPKVKRFWNNLDLRGKADDLWRWVSRKPATVKVELTDPDGVIRVARLERYVPPPSEVRAAEQAKPPLHHLATVENKVRHPQWTKRFEPLFERAGLSMQNALNKIHVPGHFGPHPPEYHQAVYDRLVSATEGLEGDAYSTTFMSELEAIGKEATTQGTELNRLLTGG